MKDHDQPTETPPPGGFWRSRTGMVLLGFLAIALLMLAWEHRVHLFAGSGGLVLLILACGAMHLFMHAWRARRPR